MEEGKKEQVLVRLIEAGWAVARSQELEMEREDGEDPVSFETLERCEDLIDAISDVELELKSPPPEEMKQFLKQRFEQEDKDLLITRLVALMDTLPDNVIRIAYCLALEQSSNNSTGS